LSPTPPPPPPTKRDLEHAGRFASPSRAPKGLFGPAWPNTLPPPPIPAYTVDVEGSLDAEGIRGYTLGLAVPPHQPHELKPRSFALMARQFPRRCRRDVPLKLRFLHTSPPAAFPCIFPPLHSPFSTASHVASAYKTPSPCDVATTAAGVLPSASTLCLFAS
jgi:hypothetical protein